MKKNVRNASIIALTAGLLFVPLVRYIIRRKRALLANTDYAPVENTKGIFSAYRGKHKANHRKSPQNGHLN